MMHAYDEKYLGDAIKNSGEAFSFMEMLTKIRINANIIMHYCN